MQTYSDATSLTIIVTTALLLFLCTGVISFLLLYQRKKYRHQQEMMEMREAFGQTLLQSKLAIQEQTLDHISKELHANFSHLVSLININLSTILPRVSEEQKANVLETKSLTKQLMGELKSLSASLNTDHTIHIGFAKALENELVRLTKTRKFQTLVNKEGEEYRLMPEHEIILFRLCQEVLNNVVKYAKASTISVLLAFSPEAFKLTITDNGIGFDVDEALGRSAKKQSTGLLNMQKRAALIHAQFNIFSHPGEGTTISINTPHPSKL